MYKFHPLVCKYIFLILNFSFFQPHSWAMPQKNTLSKPKILHFQLQKRFLNMILAKKNEKPAFDFNVMSFWGMPRK